MHGLTAVQSLPWAVKASSKRSSVRMKYSVSIESMCMKFSAGMKGVYKGLVTDIEQQSTITCWTLFICENVCIQWSDNSGISVPSSTEPYSWIISKASSNLACFSAWYQHKNNKCRTWVLDNRSWHCLLHRYKNRLRPPSRPHDVTCCGGFCACKDFAVSCYTGDSCAEAVVQEITWQKRLNRIQVGKRDLSKKRCCSH